MLVFRPSREVRVSHNLPKQQDLVDAEATTLPNDGHAFIIMRLLCVFTARAMLSAVL